MKNIYLFFFTLLNYIKPKSFLLWHISWFSFLIYAFLLSYYFLHIIRTRSIRFSLFSTRTLDFFPYCSLSGLFLSVFNFSVSSLICFTYPSYALEFPESVKFLPCGRRFLRLLILISVSKFFYLPFIYFYYSNCWKYWVSHYIYI